MEPELREDGRVRTKAGNPLRWEAKEIVLRPALPEPAVGVSLAELRAAITTSADAWNRGAAGRGVPSVRVGAEVDVGRARQDGTSVVAFQTARSCREGQLPCLGADRSAVTHLYPIDVPGSRKDGVVSEADIELNAVDFRWGADRPAALRAVLVHEIGHVLGLDHACLPSADVDAGACAAPVARRSAMYPNPLEPGRAFVLEPAPRDLLLLAPAARPASRGCEVTPLCHDASGGIVFVLGAAMYRWRRGRARA